MNAGRGVGAVDPAHCVACLRGLTEGGRVCFVWRAIVRNREGVATAELKSTVRWLGESRWSLSSAIGWRSPTRPVGTMVLALGQGSQILRVKELLSLG